MSRWEKLRVAAAKIGADAVAATRESARSVALVDASRGVDASIRSLRRQARPGLETASIVGQDRTLRVAIRHGWRYADADVTTIVRRGSVLNHLVANSQATNTDTAATEGESELFVKLRQLQLDRTENGLPKLKPHEAAQAAEALGVPRAEVATLLGEDRDRQARPNHGRTVARAAVRDRIRTAAHAALMSARLRRMTAEMAEEADLPGGSGGTGSPAAEPSGDDTEKAGFGCCRAYCGRGAAGGSRCLATAERRAAWLKRHVTDTAWFSGVVLLAIFCATVSTAIASYEKALAATDSGVTVLLVLAVLDVVVLWSFMAELVLKMLAEAPWMYPFFQDGWNVFDFVVVVLSFPGVIPVGATSVVRVARLLRVLKLVRVLPGLRRLVRSLANSLSSLAYIAGLILLLLYVWAVAGAILLGRNDPAHWKGVHNAALTLYTRGLLGDDWGEVLDTAIYGCASDRSVYTGGIGGTSVDGFPAVCTEVVLSPFSGTLLTLSWQVLGTFVCLNLLVGSIVQSVSDVDEADACASGSAAVVQVLRCASLEAADLLGTSDPYVVVSSMHEDGSTENAVRFKTKIKFRTLNPRWVNEEFIFQPLEDVGSHIVLRVFDYDRIGTDDFLGEAVVDMHLLPEHHPLELEIPLTGVSTGTITVKLERRLDAETVSLAQMSPEDRLNALCKKAEALWDAIRWELSAAAASRKRLRQRAVSKQAQALKRLAAMVSALVQAKRKVTRISAEGPDTARSRTHHDSPAGADAVRGHSSPQEEGKHDEDEGALSVEHTGSGGAGAGAVVVDRALDGWVRATSEAASATGVERVRWFKVDGSAPLDGSAVGWEAAKPGEAAFAPDLTASNRRLIGDTGWFADLAAGGQGLDGMELGDVE